MILKRMLQNVNACNLRFPSLPLLFVRLPFLFNNQKKRKIPITSQEFKLYVAFQQHKLYMTWEYTSVNESCCLTKVISYKRKFLCNFLRLSNSHPPFQEMLQILRDLQFHYHIPNSLPLLHTLSHINPVYTLIFCFFKIHFHMIASFSFG